MSNKQTFMTDEGVAVYPWLNKPDTQFDPEGTYKTGIRMPLDAAKPLIHEMEHLAKEEFGSKSTKAKLPFKVDDDTGDIIFTAKTKYQPKMVDSTGQVIAPSAIPKVWGGSKLKIKGNMNTYSAAGNIGVNLQLRAVQIIELSEGVSNSDATFAPVEGGFVAEGTSSDQKEITEEQEDYNF